MVEKKTELNVELMVKLVTQMKVEHSNMGMLIEEFETILAGRPGTGMQLKELYAEWDRAWLQRYKKKYAWQMTKDAPQMKRLLKLLGQEELSARIFNFILSDEFELKPFAFFIAAVNSVPGRNLNRAVLDAPVAGCLHTPPCQSDQQHTKRRKLEMSEVKD